MNGLKNAHIRDGAAVVQYLAWLDGQVNDSFLEPLRFSLSCALIDSLLKSFSEVK